MLTIQDKLISLYMGLTAMFIVTDEMWCSFQLTISISAGQYADCWAR